MIIVSLPALARLICMILCIVRSNKVPVFLNSGMVGLLIEIKHDLLEKKIGSQKSARITGVVVLPGWSQGEVPVYICLYRHTKTQTYEIL